MFRRPNRSFSTALLCALGVASLTFGSGPARAQEEVECDPNARPFLFILLDTSGSMNYAPRCSQAEIDVGSCSFLCNGAECHVPLQADSPDSRFHQIKSALFEALGSPEAENVLFGFGTFNQDAVYAKSKHWLYEAAAPGPVIPGWGPLPAAGSREVVGRTWTCDEGSGDNEVGCLSTNPADLSDAWEIDRMRALAKGGEALAQTVSFYVRRGTIVYRIQYVPVVGGALGAPLSFQVRSERCVNSTCTSRSSLQQAVVPFTPVSEFLLWQNYAERAEPVGYFGQTNAIDVVQTNSCSGWEPNTDTVADRFNGYSLKQPTVTGDPRGAFFDRGDVLPLDWLTDNRQDIQERLAPNLVLDPLAAPEFRVSPYLQDSRSGAETFLRLKDEAVRPLLAAGSTPQGMSLRSFRTWYAGCAAGTCPSGAGWRGVAQLQDPDFSCRRPNLLLISDGVESCPGANACSVAADLRVQFNVRTFVVGSSHPLSGSMQDCIAANGGTGQPFEPHLYADLVQAFRDVFWAAGQP